MSCGVPVIGTPMGDDVPQIVCERTTESVVEGIKQFVFQRHSLIAEARKIAENYDWKIIVENNLLKWYFEILDRNNMANTARRIYHQSTINKVQDTMMFKYLDGARVDLVGSSDFQYKAELFIQDTQEIVYSAQIKCGMFAQSARKYHRNYAWKITDEKGNEFIQPYDAKNKRVYVAIESSSLGDSLAWMPIIEEFRLVHSCKLIVSTFWNDMFKDAYPEIEFIRAGTPVNNIYAMYRIGWYYENDGLDVHFGHHSRDFRKFSLQGTACDILGLPDIEVKPKIKEVEGQKFNKKYVVIAPHASSHCKYWHNEEGWAKVVEFLNDLGYEVWNISKESASSDWENSKLSKNALINVIDKTGDIHIDERISQIKSSSLFIGLGSGLSWLAWACGTPTVLISGFSRPVSEFTDCTRVFNQDVCNGCFNDYRLDAGNWNWCPKYENTDKMYECSKSITPEQVIDAIRKTLTKHQTAPDG
jgi:autotransporter strand-loop-strand O-heptosyltransferase